MSTTPAPGATVPEGRVGDLVDLEVDNSGSVLERIAALYAAQLMSDVTLQVGGVELPAHRLILCASSEVFHVMLMGREWSESRESRVTLTETPAAARVFPAFLRYFYTGQIRISQGSVLAVLALADKYNVRDLATLCLRYMHAHVPRAARPRRLVAWLQYAAACGHDRLATACQDFLKCNIEWVLAAEPAPPDDDPDGELDGELLVQLLQQDELVVHNEMALYKVVARWAARVEARLPGDEAEARMPCVVRAVFAHVRFPMMGARELAALLLDPLAQRHRDYFMERMARAMAFQAGAAPPAHPAHERALYAPRLYTEDVWGSVLAVDNFHSLPCYHARTFMFSTRATLREPVSPAASPDLAELAEWSVDLYPKGVWFRKALLIVWAGTYDVPEHVLRCVRVAVTCQSAPGAAELRARVAVLVRAQQHVTRVLTRVHRFSDTARVLNIDGALDFDELNTPLYSPADVGGAARREEGECGCCGEGPRLLQGPQRDQLRVQVVIVPLPAH